MTQRVLITAAAGGIGRAIAQAFVTAGARVHICDVDAAALAETLALWPGVTGSLTDVADPHAMATLFDDALAALGGLDVLVNNAGIAGPTAAVEDIRVEDWERTLAVNLHSAFYGIRLAVPQLKAAGGGCIINISSAAGRLGYPLRTPYSASKWALIGLTQSLAMELGPQHIRVNAILPGVVEGERVDRVVAAKAEALGISAEEQRRRLLARVSLRQTIPPSAVGDLCLFLASPAGAYISGQSLGVCGNLETLG